MFSPIATGILTGAATGFMMGAGPAGMVAGAVIGGIQAKSAEDAQYAARSEAKRLGINNQNAMVEQGYRKKNQARGIGDMTSPTGNQASQTGTVLTSVTGDSQNSLLG